MKNTTSFVALMAALATGSALAADLPYRKAPVDVPPPPSTWTGLYIGMNAGYSMAGSDTFQDGGLVLRNAFTIAPPGSANAAALSSWSTGHASMSGFLGGGQAGYNYQWTSFVAGLEADIQGSGVNGEGSAGGAWKTGTAAGASAVSQTAIDLRKDVDWLGTVRGRVGWLYSPTLLLYATGGLAYGNVSASANLWQGWSGVLGPAGLATTYSTGGASTFHSLNTGYTVGGGVEWMIAPGWSLKAEYLYYNLGTVSFATNWANAGFLSTFGAASIFSTSHTTTFDGHIVRAGVNHHFDLFSAPPILAKF